MGDAMAQQIQFELNSAQNEWRQQLTGIMEVLTHITDTFTDVKRNIDTVQNNHQQLSQLLTGEEEEGSESETASDSTSSEESEENEGKPSGASAMVPGRRRSAF